MLGVVLCGALVLWEGPVAMAQWGEETCYVALGDSISSGYGLEDDTQRFTQQVACENGFTLISLAQNGETSHTLLERLQDPEAMQAVAQADVISITIGGNDLMNALYEYLTQRYNESHPDSPTTVEQTREALMGGQVPMLTFAMGEIQGFSTSGQEQEALSQFAHNLAQVVSEIQAINPGTCLVVANQYNPYSYLLREFAKYPPFAHAAQEMEEAFGGGVSALNEAIASVGKQLECPVVDIYSLFEGAQENPCNADVSAFAKVNLDFHPNAYGHHLIAQAVIAATNQQLQVSGHGAQTVNGETTQLTQRPDRSEGWKWAIPWCGAGLGGLCLIAWGRRHGYGEKRRG